MQQKKLQNGFDDCDRRRWWFITGFCEILTFAKKCLVLNSCERVVRCLCNRINHLKPYLNQHNTTQKIFHPLWELQFLPVRRDSSLSHRFRKKIRDREEEEQQWNWNGFEGGKYVVTSAWILGTRISQIYKQPGRRRTSRASATSDDDSGIAAAAVKKKTPLLPLLQKVVKQKRCWTRQRWNAHLLLPRPWLLHL